MSTREDRLPVGAALRELRRSAGLTGAAMARQAGWSQPKVSRIETGAVVPSERDLRAWLDVTGVGSDRFDELWSSCQDARDHERAPSAANERSHDSSGCRLIERYERCVRFDLERGGFRAYRPGQVPSILMTRTFLREALETAPASVVHCGDGRHDDLVAAIVNLRVMHQDMLYSRDTAVQVVLGESALYCRPGSVQTMLGQLDRLLELHALPGLDLRVLTFDDPYPAPTSVPFVLYGDSVRLPALADDLWNTDPHDVGLYTALMDELSDRALAGDDVHAVVDRARRWHAARFEDRPPSEGVRPLLAPTGVSSEHDQ